MPSLVGAPSALVRAYRGSLLLRLLLVAVTVVALCIGGLGVLVSTTTNKEFAAQFAAQQQSAAAILADSVNREFEERVQALELASSVISKAPRLDSTSVQSYLEARPVLSALFSGGLFFTGTDGVALASVPVDLGRVGVSYADRPFVQAALAGRSVFGEPVIGKKMGRAIITIAAPVYGSDGRVHGALVGVIDLGQPGFLDRIAKSRYGKTGGYVLVAPASRMIVTATDTRLIMTATANHPTISRWVAGEDGTGELINSLGVHLVGSAKHLPVNGWYVAANMPIAEAYAPMASLQENILKMAAVLLLLGLVAGTWALHRELVPLARAARVLAAHRNSGLPVRELPVGRQDEIGMLIHGFNDLLISLRAREATVEAHRQRLSALVQSLYVGVAVLDAQARVVLSNARADTLLPRVVNAEGLLDQSGAALQAQAHPVSRALKTRQPAPDVVVGVPATAAAPAAWLLVSAVPQVDAAGEVQEVVVTLLDVSQQMQVRLALQKSNADREALLREVHHRVKNNLQVVTSLLRLESRRSDLPQLHVAFEDMQGRIRSMALLHEMLYREGDFASIDLGQYLRQIANQVFRSQSAPSGAVRLETELQSVAVGLDQATPCGLLVNELISNCIKHGFPQGRSGMVRLTLQRDVASGMVVLCISDDGVGLPADFEQRRMQSLGMQLSDDLARQIGGKLNTEIDGGTRFTVQFGVQKNA